MRQRASLGYNVAEMNSPPQLGLFPDTAAIDDRGHLLLGGCDTRELVAHFGSPLYVFDEATLRSMCRRFQGEFTGRYPQTLVLYACKAYISPALARLFQEEGLGLDVVSAGELAIARRAEFPLERVFFHGNNKGADELKEAMDAGVGRIVVDNFQELSLLENLAEASGRVQEIMLRLSPGIDPHTHGHLTTGVLDSKFGFPLASGQAEAALAQALASPHLRVVGLHCHIGSQIFEVEPYRGAIQAMMAFAAEMKRRYGFVMREFSPGGGFALQYVGESPAPSITAYADAIVFSVQGEVLAWGLEPPRLIIEPGRAIVGRAGVALYTVGAIKDIPGVRKYVSVDGGMADNIRPAIYGARYEALVANKAGEASQERVTIAGKFCESGDILIRDIDLPPLDSGDILAVPGSGAYCLAMASNYNASLKAAVVLVKEGQIRLIRRRETYEDLMRNDLW